MTEEAVITSVQNSAVKNAVKLHDAKGRKEIGLILIEGRHPVEEAILAGLDLETIFVRQDEPLLVEAPADQVLVTEGVMAKMSTTDTPPPVIAIAKAPQQAMLSAPGKILALFGLQDPGNMGTLVRSACAFGVGSVVLIGRHVDPYQPKVIRASAGLVFRLSIFSMPDIVALEKFAKESKLAVWAADAKRGISYRDAQYSDDVMLVMGAEADGLPNEIWKFAQAIHIPMAENAESLNVGVAGSILLCEMFGKK